MNVLENITLAMASVNSNKLRTFLTLLSISIGVFAITGAGALVESIDATVTSEVERLGETVYYVSRLPMVQMGHHHWQKYSARKHLTYKQFHTLKEHSVLPIDFCIWQQLNGKRIKLNEEKTDNDVILIGAEESFFSMLNYPIETGRGFNQLEIKSGLPLAIIGKDVALKLSKDGNVLGKLIKIEQHTFTVIGITKSQGSMMGQSRDNYAVIPITCYIKYYAENGTNTDFTYALKAPNKELLQSSIDETIGVLRSLRNCKPWEKNNFEVENSSSLSEQFSSITQYLSFFGAACGSIALLAAGVGIMNIMLVSVKERTREIGIRKAVGAKSVSILAQFLIEAVTLCQIGAIAGIILGILVGWIFGTLMGIKLGFPYLWVIFSIITCTVLGVVSGAYPAWKAAKLDPIEALRYE